MLSSSYSPENTHANSQKLQLKSYLDCIFRVSVMHRFSEIKVKKSLYFSLFYLKRLIKQRFPAVCFFNQSHKIICIGVI